MDVVDSHQVRAALGKIEDGIIFEKFAQQFLNHFLGHGFV